MRLFTDTVLFQHIYSYSDYASILALTMPRTIMYCYKFKIDYRFVMGEVEGDAREGGHWANIYLMREFMQMGYKNVIYLDADTIICNLNTDIREAIVEDKVGAVWHNSHEGERDLSHYNAGAFYASNTYKTRAFLDKWISQKPGQTLSKFPLCYEQGAFRIIGDEMGVINRLDNQWNAEAGVSPSDHPVVLGFHGFKDVYGCMSITLKDLEAK